MINWANWWATIKSSSRAKFVLGVVAVLIIALIASAVS